MTERSDAPDDELVSLIKDIALAPFRTMAEDACPKCGGELTTGKHRFTSDGGAPDCSWLYCLECDYQTDPE